MLRTDRTALICDLAETYGVLNYRELPVETLAALAVGLREDSRIRMKMSGAKLDTITVLLTGILDRLSILAWQNTEDAVHGRNRPDSLLEKLLKEPEEKPTVFATPEEFERARSAFLKG